MMPIGHYLFLSLALFLIGAIGVVTRRNVIIVLMSIELILERREYQSGGIFQDCTAMWRGKFSRFSSLPMRLRKPP